MGDGDHVRSLIVEMLDRAGRHDASFPATELYSETWMLRLVLEAASEGYGAPFGRLLDGSLQPDILEKKNRLNRAEHRQRDDRKRRKYDKINGLPAHPTPNICQTNSGGFRTDKSTSFVGELQSSKWASEVESSRKKDGPGPGPRPRPGKMLLEFKT